MRKTVICLANSRKTSGRCYAGKEFSEGKVGEWCRPVSDTDTHEIAAADYRYEDHSEAMLFDVIRFRHLGAAKHTAQRENVLNDREYYWVKEGTSDLPLESFLDEPQSLWVNNYSSYYGLNDRVQETLIEEPIQSLYFIYVENPTVHVRIEGAEFDNPKKRVRIAFDYNSVDYLLSITDVVQESYYLNLDEGKYLLEGGVYLTISLGESYGGYYYKLAAAVIRE
ncbi:dual OB domain-containing protein [Vibrio campbellii]|uniref:dual OB domain-containing protein n=1 Tax=Vibrio campbellii TaxID=680 RepID=UPI0038CD4DDF